MVQLQRVILDQYRRASLMPLWASWLHHPFHGHMTSFILSVSGCYQCHSKAVVISESADSDKVLQAPDNMVVENIFSKTLPCYVRAVTRDHMVGVKGCAGWDLRGSRIFDSGNVVCGINTHRHKGERNAVVNLSVRLCWNRWKHVYTGLAGWRVCVCPVRLLGAERGDKRQWALLESTSLRQRKEKCVWRQNNRQTQF